nr:hypothetical protein [Nanoarchaeota archaeon]
TIRVDYDWIRQQAVYPLSIRQSITRCEGELNCIELIKAEEKEIPEEVPEIIPEIPPIEEPLPTLKAGLKPLKRFFKQKEDAVFEFEFEVKEKIKFLKKPSQYGVWQTPRERIVAELIEPTGKKADVLPEIEQLEDGKFRIKIPTQRAFRPGVYGLRVELTREGVTYFEEQQFLWGVLAINTHKSIYLPNETAFIGIAVLDNAGRMVCDADVTLEITAPDGSITILSTSDNTIKVSPECRVYGVTNLPDYYTYYGIGGVGNYSMNLTAITRNGVRSLIDNFVVQESVDFDVARDGPTRIYPPVPYVMNFTIKANQNYTGPIKEFVPASFNITSQQGLTIITVNDTKILEWSKELVAGETYNLAYEFDAPDVSPYLFTLGALEIGSWKEARNWMIASDADTLITLRPNADGSTGVWSAKSAGSFFVEINETFPNSDGEGSYVQGTNKNDDNTQEEYLFVALENTPSNFLNASTVILRVSHKENGDGSGAGDDFIEMYYQIFLSDETTQITDEVGPYIVNQDNYETNVTTMTINGPNNKTAWDGARLRIRQIHDANQAGDTTSQGRVSTIEINITGDTAPTWSDANKNKSPVYQNDNLYFNTTWNDDNGLSAYVFSIDQGSGYVNSSYVSFSGTTNVSENTTQITASAGTTVKWKFYANDTDGHWSVTSEQEFTVASSIVINNEQAVPRFVRNNTNVNISANVTHVGGLGIDTVIARIYYPNGTSAVNYSMTNTSGSIYWNASYTVDFGILSTYNVTIFANDTNSVSNTALTNFSP